jgi:DNA-binding GntR family transcriptional regulator
MSAVTTISKSTNGTRSRGGGGRTVYEALRAEILSLSLEPGELLDESRIGQRFGLSRSPVREALIRLGSEGLVTTLPNKSTLVAPLNVEAFPQYLDALDLLQRATTRLAAVQHNAGDLASICAAQETFEDALSRHHALDMIQANRDFHVAIGEAGHNRYLAHAYGRLLDEGRRILRLYFRSYGDTLPSQFADEHPRIIAAITARDADLAEQLAHEHALNMGRGFLEYLSTRHTDQVVVGNGPPTDHGVLR